MSGGGLIFDMINRLKQNKLSKRKKFQGDNRKALLSEGAHETTTYNFPTFSTAQMEVFKKHLLEQNKKDRTTTIIASLIGVTLVVLLFLFLYK
ncbi:MAG: isoprenylcysteine carboxyl methyltransferase (ICMT) family protein YpbQ [Maribacter sp.]|jgi:isoprenylcysteine carboxyl methyltransferase (ICMT) family protein YpbQ